MNEELFEAAVTGDVKKVDELIHAGADVNTKDRWNETPLFPAVRNGHTEVVKTLLKAGADQNVRNEPYGDYPMLIAVIFRHEAIIKLLEEYGVKRVVL